MVCLRTPRGAGAEGKEEVGKRVGGGELNKGMTSACFDSPVSSITWLLGEDMDLSGKQEV